MRFFDMLRNERGEVGPKKDDDPEKDDEIIVDPALDLGDDDDDDDDETGELEIDLDDDDDAGKKHPAEIRLDKEKQKLKEDNERLARQVEELNAQRPIAPAVPPINYADPNDRTNWTDAQWDELAQKDWKLAVDARAEIKAKQQYEHQTQNTEFVNTLEASKNSVLSRHPELGEENSEKSKIYRNIVTANPEYTQMKEGPLFAMYKMEEFMEKNMGYRREDIVKAEQRGRDTEQERLNRVQLTTAGRNVSRGNKVILTKDEQEFCEIQGIDPKMYATNKKKLSTSGSRGGIQL